MPWALADAARVSLAYGTEFQPGGRYRPGLAADPECLRPVRPEMARRKLAPRYVLVHGRRDNFESVPRRREKRAELGRPDERLISFDRLTPAKNSVCTPPCARDKTATESPRSRPASRCSIPAGTTSSFPGGPTHSTAAPTWPQADATT